MLPDPLDKSYEKSFRGPVRLLSDRGIRQALAMELITVEPGFDEKDTARIQPVTIDMKIKEVDYVEPISSDVAYKPGGNLTLDARCISSVVLTEFIDVWQGEKIYGDWFLGLFGETRSSLHRLGMFNFNRGKIWPGPTQYIELGNFSHNNIHLVAGERVAQFFISVHPYADWGYEDSSLWAPEDAFVATPEMGEKVRGLDMGMEAVTEEQIKQLHKEGYFEVTPRFVCEKANLLVHASTVAYRIRKIEGGIHFSKREEYELREPIDISKGYTIDPCEHIIIETREQFSLSPHVGIRFWDNYWHFKEHQSYGHLTNPDLHKSMPFVHLADGWIDPGYEGIFGRQPKWMTGRTIYPGDVIGFGQVFFFPNGVERPYGSEGLGSQYQNKDEIAFSK